MKTHRQIVAEWEEQDPEFRQARRDLEPEYAFRRALIRARLTKGLTQQQLANELGTTQSAIARLEKGTWEPRIRTLHRLAQILDIEITIGPEEPFCVSRRKARHSVTDRERAPA